jgi:quinol monooxygenase YgiN
VDYHFHISLDDPNMFYFYENRAERADFDRHIALDYQKDWFAKQGDFWRNRSNFASSRW